MRLVDAGKCRDRDDEEKEAQSPLADEATRGTGVCLLFAHESHNKEGEKVSGSQCTRDTPKKARPGAFLPGPVSRTLGAMKISRDWLSDFIDWIETDPEVVADRITRGMGEVDEVEKQGAIMENVVVGKILTLGKHPNADKLSVCTVETDRGVKKIVCGGTNLKEGMLVALAHVGATVKAGGKEMFTLTKAKIRGEESEGMICASEEIDIESMFPPKPEDGARPVADLTSRGFKPGTPLQKALGLCDVIFHVDNHAITNRPDLFSVVGVARELVAMGVATWKKEPTLPATKFAKDNIPFGLKNDAPDLVPYYEAALLHVDASGPSPEWMQRRLTACGWRPISLIVDVTNYVLMEVGMPLHAFDADDFRGELHIRTAKKGEKITTLDEKQRDLPDGAIVMSDDAGIFDLFAIMGGLRTSQKPTTRNIFLQAGIPDPVTIRRTTIAMAHRTDAATVYEKGVMPVTSSMGLRRALELLAAHGKDFRIQSKLVTWGKGTAQKAVKVDREKIVGYIGAPIDGKRVKKILTDLGCTVKGTSTALTVTPPLWRRDITHVQDLAEEVARVYGYANVVPTMPEASIVPPTRDVRVNMIRDGLKEERATELLHLAFTSPATVKKSGGDPSKAVSIENPIGEELSLMRMSLVPALLETAGREVTRGQIESVKFFEYGQVFAPGVERPELAFVIAAKGKTTLKEDPTLIAKADLTRAMKSAGYALTFIQKKDHLPPFAHAGRSAEIRCSEKSIGLLTEVAPHMRKGFDLPSRAAIAVIDLQALLAIEPHVLIASGLPAFPPIEFDETVELPKTSLSSLVKRLAAINPLLRNVAVVNLYEGDIGKRLTLRFTYRADDRTLTQEEVEKIHTAVLAELKKA